MSAKAVIQFNQDRTVFGADATFQVEFASGEHYIIRGGRLGRIRLTEVGIIRMRALLDGYSSSWFELEIREGELVDLQIGPPESAVARAFGLLTRRDDYLLIREFARKTVYKKQPD